MGFWQGINEGLTYNMEKKALREERQQALDLRKQERLEDREWAAQDRREAFQQGLMGDLYKTMLEKNMFSKTSADPTHELSVLKSMGASDDVLAEVAAYGPAALKEAVTILQAQQEKLAGSPLKIGPTQVDAFLSAGISTVTEAGEPDMQKAASILGLTPEDLEKPFVGGLTMGDVVKGGLAAAPTRKTTWINPSVGKPLDAAAISTIQTSANKNLADALTSQEVYYSQQAAALREKEAKGMLSEEEAGIKTNLIGQLDALRVAKEALKNDAPLAAIELVGGQAIMPYVMNNPAALNYNFGPGWSQAISRYTFDSEEAVVEAARANRIKPGDLVVLNGEVVTVR